MNYEELSRHFITSAFELMDLAKMQPYPIAWSKRLEKRLDNKYILIITDETMSIGEMADDGMTIILCAWVKRHSDKWNVGRLLDKYLTLLEEES